ncbi:golgin subfamily A member 1 [Protopterus annectens]|uniref:golgin subfamily A member 1 n=1 Tax=Protopterus annectens TaxID=7888 RepID=UPI001CFB83C7|nr:golgin subfamily A member 1 [Protopterus annectens]
MFAKLKKKLEEEATATALRPGGAARIPRSISKESVTSVGADSGDDFASDGSSCKDDLSSRLHRKNDHIRKLEGRLSEYAEQVRNLQKTKEKLEIALEKHQDFSMKKLQEQSEVYQANRTKMTEGMAQALEKKDQEWKERIAELEKEKELLSAQLLEMRQQNLNLFQKRDDIDELEGFHQQELAKVKHMLLTKEESLTKVNRETEQQTKELVQTKEDMHMQRQRLLELEDTVEQLQRNMLDLTSERDELLAMKLSAEDRIGELVRSEQDLQNIIQQLSCSHQKAQDTASVLEKTLSSIQRENELLMLQYEQHKQKAIVEFAEKDKLIAHLQEKVSFLEKRIEGNFSEDDHVQALIEEKTGLELKLAEERQQLLEARTSNGETVSILETQVIKELNNTDSQGSDEFRFLKSNFQPPMNKHVSIFLQAVLRDLHFPTRDSSILAHNLSAQEIKALDELINNHDIVIASADKGGVVVVMKMDYYLNEVAAQNTKSYTEQSKSEEKTCFCWEGDGILEMQKIEDNLALVSKLNNKIAEMQTLLEEKENSLQSFKEDSANQITELDHRLQDLNTKLKESDGLLNEKETLSKKLQADFEVESHDLRQQIAAARHQSTERVNQLETQIASLETARERDKTAAQHNISQLEQEIGTLRERRVEVETSLKNNEAELEKTKVELKSREMISVEIAKALEETRKQREELQQQITDLIGVVNQKDQAVVQQREELMRTKEDFNKLKEEYDEVLLQLKQLQVQFDMAKSTAVEKEAAAEKRLDALKQELLRQQEHLEARQRRAVDLEEEVKILSDQLYAQINDKKVQNGELTTADVLQLQKQNRELEQQIAEKNKTVKQLQQRLAELKKTLQKELRLKPEAELGDGKDKIPEMPSVLTAATVVTNSSDLNDLREINFDYLKHVVLKFMSARESEAFQLIKVLSVLLNFTLEEENMLKETLEYKMSWFGSKPAPRGIVRPSVSSPRTLWN